MESWFRSRYEDPAARTPYESREGGYIWIWGGPYDAEIELRGEFDELVPGSVIDALAADLGSECWEWAPTPSPEDYDHSLFDVVFGNAHTQRTLSESLDTILLLVQLPHDGALDQSLNRLLYANGITVLETYLSDTFINRVLAESSKLRAFVETTPDFQKRTVQFSDVFKIIDAVRDEARRYMLNVVWHNLAKVQSMYRDTLAVDMRAKLGPVAAAIPKRHDIVHRNGKDHDGNPLSITAQDVSDLVKAIRELVNSIESQLTPTTLEW